MPPRTWNEAARRWTSENTRRASETIRRETRLLGFAAEKIGTIEINLIRASTLLSLRGDAMRLGWSARSCNYLIQTIRTILRACSSWDWLDRDPPFVKPLRTPTGRTRWLTTGQAEQLIAALPVPINAMAVLALETGLRRSNITLMQWEWIDLDRRTITIPAGAIKTRIPIHVPLTDRSVEILTIARAYRTDLNLIGRGYVFTREDKPIRQPCGRAWLKALADLGIEDFRWHDLRHTWASWHAQAGTELNVLKELGGWKTLAMVDRYAHLAIKQKQIAVQQLDLWRSVE